MDAMGRYPAMGGDFAPREIVRGAITYAASHADEVILVVTPISETSIRALGHVIALTRDAANR